MPSERSAFFEELPAWQQADLTIGDLKAKLGRRATAPVRLVATVENCGMAASAPTQVRFFVDGRVVQSARVEPLAAGGRIE